MSELTPTERRVLWQLVSGLDAARVAEWAGITLATLRTHLRNMYRKTSTHDLASLLAWGWEYFTGDPWEPDVFAPPFEAAGT